MSNKCATLYYVLSVQVHHTKIYFRFKVLGDNPSAPQLNNPFWEVWGYVEGQEDMCLKGFGGGDTYVKNIAIKVLEIHLKSNSNFQLSPLVGAPSLAHAKCCCAATALPTLFKLLAFIRNIGP